MTRYATAFKGLRIVTLKKKDKKIQDALKSIRNGELCHGLSGFAPGALKDADIVLLAYNSEGVVKGVAGVNEGDDDLYVSIICNAMGKKNRGGGYAPGKGLLDLLKKIAVQKKKPLTLAALSNVINYYKRFGFKQHPNSKYKGNLIWQWNPSYSRARRFEYQSVNSNYNSNNNKPPTIYRRTRSKVTSPTGSNRSSATGSNRSSATVKRRKSTSPTSSNRSNATVKRLARVRNRIAGTKIKIRDMDQVVDEANIKEMPGWRLKFTKKFRNQLQNQKTQYKTELKNLKSDKYKKELKRFKEARERDYKLLKKMPKNAQVSTRKILNESYTSIKQALKTMASSTRIKK